MGKPTYSAGRGIAREQIERAARLYNTSREAAAALGIAELWSLVPSLRHRHAGSAPAQEAAQAAEDDEEVVVRLFVRLFVS